jgi:hypothetical protein
MYFRKYGRLNNVSLQTESEGELRLVSSLRSTAASVDDGRRESGGVLLTAAQADGAIKPAHTRSFVASWVRKPMPAIQPLRVRLRKVRVSSIVIPPPQNQKATCPRIIKHRG